MRINWGNRAHADIPILLPEYEPSVGAHIKSLETYWGHEAGDPAKVARVIVELSRKEHIPAHLLLGSDAVQYARLAEEKRESDAKEWVDVSLSTDSVGVGTVHDCSSFRPPPRIRTSGFPASGSYLR
jgi:hypothetical protein